MIDVSIVIVTWNGRSYLDACLAAVAAQEGVSAETILVDNGSTDGTVAHVAHMFPWVRIVALPANLGFAGGNNVGALEARGRYLAFLNNDTIVDRGWLRALLDGLDEDDGFALATSRIVYMHDPSIVDSAGDGVLRWGGAFKRLHGASTDEANEPAEVFGVCGAAFVLKKSLFDELAGFDEAFFASHEDVDLSYRARLLGHRVRYVPTAVVRHHGSATLGRVSEFSVFHGQRNLEWVYFKNSPASILWRTFPGHLLYNLAAAVYFLRAGRLWTFMRAKAAAVRGLPAIWRKRASVQRTRRVGAAAIWPLLERRWLSRKLGEKRFDLGMAGGRR